jgi:hypothetical protein
MEPVMDYVWEPSVSEEKRQIVAVAVRKHEAVASLPKPARHVNLLAELRYVGIDADDWEQGFMTSDGQYVTRFQARAIAVKSGQIVKAKCPPDLYSEDVW